MKIGSLFFIFIPQQHGLKFSLDSTRSILLATSPHSSVGVSKESNKKKSNKEDAIVMDTKLKVIEILQVCIHVYLTTTSIVSNIVLGMTMEWENLKIPTKSHLLIPPWK